MDLTSSLRLSFNNNTRFSGQIQLYYLTRNADAHIRYPCYTLSIHLYFAPRLAPSHPTTEQITDDFVRLSDDCASGRTPRPQRENVRPRTPREVVVVDYKRTTRTQLQKILPQNKQRRSTQHSSPKQNKQGRTETHYPSILKYLIESSLSRSHNGNRAEKFFASKRPGNLLASPSRSRIPASLPRVHE